MENSTLSGILALKNASLPELQKKYEEVFEGKKAPSNNKVYLWRKIAYRMQELEYGGVPAATTSPIQLFDAIVRNLSSTY